MGYIYKICNDINECVYIGQTKNEVSERFKGHIKSLKDPQKNKTLLYDAMNNYGLSHFYFETIEECDDELLNQEEKKIY